MTRLSYEPVIAANGVEIVAVVRTTLEATVSHGLLLAAATRRPVALIVRAGGREERVDLQDADE